MLKNLRRRRTQCWTSHEILENVEERFGYFENDPLLKAAAVLDPEVWPKDQIELST